MYDHRFGIAALMLLAVPFALTFALIATVGLATTCLLLGHAGTLLSTVLRVLLPIPMLTGYFDALSSPYSLLCATLLVAGSVGAWIYLAVRYDHILFHVKPQAFAPVDNTTLEQPQQAFDDRTVTHHGVEDELPISYLDHDNPYIRRVLRNTDYDSFSQMHEPTPESRLRPIANSFDFSPDPRQKPRQDPRQHSLRPTANTFEWKSEGQPALGNLAEHVPRTASAGSWNWPAAGVKREDRAVDGHEGDATTQRRSYKMNYP